MAQIPSYTKEKEYNEFVNYTNPDLTSTLDWIEHNLEIDKVFNFDWDYEPEDMFNTDSLDRWATKNCYVHETETLSRKDVKKLIDAIAELNGLFVADSGKYQKQIDALYDAVEIVQDQL